MAYVFASRGIPWTAATGPDEPRRVVRIINETVRFAVASPVMVAPHIGLVVNIFLSYDSVSGLTDSKTNVAFDTQFVPG